MRLTPKDKKILIETAGQLFPTHTAVYLFGSKADDTKKGGDIDILVLSNVLPNRKQIRRLKILLKEKLGDQRIDVVAAPFDSTDTFVHLIKNEGIKLWER